MNTMKTQSFLALLLLSFLLAVSAQGQTDVLVVDGTGRVGLEECDDRSCTTVVLDTWDNLHLVALFRDGLRIGYEVWSPRSNAPETRGVATGGSVLSQGLRNARIADTTPARDGHKEPITIDSFSWGTTNVGTVSTVCGTLTDATTQEVMDYCWVISSPETDVSEASLRTYVIPHVFEQKGRSARQEDWTLSVCNPCTLTLSGTSRDATSGRASVVSPRDAASGLPTGKRQHKPVSVSTTTGADAAASTTTQQLDKSSPQLMLRVVTLHTDNTATVIATYDLKMAKK